MRTVIAKYQDNAIRIYYGLIEETFKTSVIEENFILTDRAQFSVLFTSNRSTNTNPFQISVALSHRLKASENLKVFFDVFRGYFNATLN